MDNGKTILVVDDSQTVRHHVAVTLRRAGFTMAEAADGAEGLAMLFDSNRRIDMVICDINMPKMNGLEMLELMKGRRRSIPIVMLTTEGQMALIKRAKKAGAVGWIVKPFNPTQLVQTVCHLTGEAVDGSLDKLPA